MRALCQFEDDGSGIVPANIMGHLRTDDSEDHTHGASGAIRTSSWQDDYATNLVD